MPPLARLDNQATPRRTAGRGASPVGAGAAPGPSRTGGTRNGTVPPGPAEEAEMIWQRLLAIAGLVLLAAAVVGFVARYLAMSGVTG